MEVGSGGVAMGFSQEVVQEFQVSSVNADLSTGVTGSGAINVVTRSGSNHLRGSAFLFFRDHTLAANPALKRDAFNPDPLFQRRQFGFEKRFSRRWQFLASYAWSSNVGNSFGNGFDNTNWLANYGPLDRDMRHILNLSGVVELPKSFQLGWTSTYNSMPPFSAFLGGFDLNGDGTTGDLPPGTTVNQFNRSLGKSDLAPFGRGFQR
jgi:hypothetical protein